MQKIIDTKGTRWVKGEAPDIAQLPTISAVAAGDFVTLYDDSGEIIGKFDAQTINWKLEDAVIVSQSGKGDASTISDGITYATNQGKDLVLVDQGTYSEKDLVLPANMSMVALGRGATISASGSGTQVLTCQGSNYVVGMDISVVGGSAYLLKGITVNDLDVFLIDTRVYMLSNTTSDSFCVYADQGSSDKLYIQDCYLNGTNVTTGDLYALYGNGAGTTFVQGSQLLISATNGYGAFAGASHTINFENNPIVTGVSGSVSGTGSFYGMWQDNVDSVMRIEGADIVGNGTSLPDLGSTTAAEKWGNIYLAPAKDIFPLDNEAGLGTRLDSFLDFDEHFDDLSALPSGWAWAGSPFVTPTVAYQGSYIEVSHAAAARSFLYKTHSGGDVAQYTVMMATNSTSATSYAGPRLDDGSDNNYSEAIIQVASSSTWTADLARNVGGGGRTTTTGSTFYHPVAFITLNCYTTRWSSWDLNAMIRGLSTAGLWVIRTATVAPSLTWTPTRQGVVINWQGASWHRWYIDAFEGE